MQGERCGSSFILLYIALRLFFPTPFVDNAVLSTRCTLGTCQTQEAVVAWPQTWVLYSSPLAYLAFYATFKPFLLLQLFSRI